MLLQQLWFELLSLYSLDETVGCVVIHTTKHHSAFQDIYGSKDDLKLLIYIFNKGAIVYGCFLIRHTL